MRRRHTDSGKIRCPKCHSQHTKEKSRKLQYKKNSYYRIYDCTNCGHTFKTVEIIYENKEFVANLDYYKVGTKLSVMKASFRSNFKDTLIKFIDIYKIKNTKQLIEKLSKLDYIFRFTNYITSDELTLQDLEILNTNPSINDTN